MSLLLGTTKGVLFASASIEFIGRRMARKTPFVSRKSRQKKDQKLPAFLGNHDRQTYRPTD